MKKISKIFFRFLYITFIFVSLTLIIFFLALRLIGYINGYTYEKRFKEIKKILKVEHGDNLEEVISYVIKEGMTCEELKHKLKPLEKLSFIEVMDYELCGRIYYIFDMEYISFLKNKDILTIEIEKGKVKKFSLETLAS